MQIRSNLTTGMMSFSFSWTVVSYLKIEHESVTKEKEKNNDNNPAYEQMYWFVEMGQSDLKPVSYFLFTAWDRKYKATSARRQREGNSRY